MFLVKGSSLTACSLTVPIPAVSDKFGKRLHVHCFCNILCFWLNCCTCCLWPACHILLAEIPEGEGMLDKALVYDKDVEFDDSDGDYEDLSDLQVREQTLPNSVQIAACLPGRQFCRICAAHFYH